MAERLEVLTRAPKFIQRWAESFSHLSLCGSVTNRTGRGALDTALIQSLAEIEQCRRLAAEISDPETAKRLLKLADELEQRLREVDRE